MGAPGPSWFQKKKREKEREILAQFAAARVISTEKGSE